MPHEFVVTVDVVDAWTRATGQRIGSVFLTRTDGGDTPQVSAFTATCPHLGCAVEFDAGEKRFECPCHESGFDKDGERLFGPSLRGLDPLEIKLVDKGGAKEVWVAFQRFRAGVAERVPVG
jgi:Rieske Fe-S protein